MTEEAALKAACKPWEHHVGEPPDYDSPLSGVFGAGISYAHEQLARLVGIGSYELGDGSEDFETDVRNTGGNILQAAGYVDGDGDLYIPRDANCGGRAVLDVLAERGRQIRGEGWSTDHDDQHVEGELSAAAANYVTAARLTMILGGKAYAASPPLSGFSWPVSWPWDVSWWKPGAVRRMLVKAAALIIAEIERLDRREVDAPDA